MKKVSHKKQIENLLGIYYGHIKAIDLMWEEHLSFINWDKKSEFYEPYILFSLRYVWEIIKEYGYEYEFDCYNKIMTYVYERENELDIIKLEEGIDDCVEAILKEYLMDRNMLHYKRFDKQYNEYPYFKYDDTLYTKINSTFFKTIMEYVFAVIVLIIITPYIIYKSINDWIIRIKEDNQYRPSY
jgi:hypothetical protein